MKNNEKGKRVLKALDVIFNSTTFITIQYLLMCCMIAFKTSPAYIFFIALNTSVITKYWSELRATIPNKMLFIIIFTVNFILVGVLLYTLGYLEISIKDPPHLSKSVICEEWF